MAHRTFPRWFGALGVAILAVTLFGLSPASGQTAADKRAEAERIAERVDDLSREIEIVAEQYNAAQIELARLQGEVAQAEADVAATRSQMAARQAEVRTYAVSAYISGGDTNPLPVLLSSENGNDAEQRRGYLSTAVGDRQQLVDQLGAAEEDLQTKIDILSAAEARAEGVAAEIAARRAAADRAVAEQQALLRQAQGELAELVRQEDARRAEAAAAAAAAAAASHQAPPASGGGNGGGGSGGGDSGGGGGDDSGGGGGDTGGPPVSGGAAGAVAMARTLIGSPYVWGADGPDSFDCSGFTQYVWNQGGGVYLPHNSGAQYSATTHIPMSEIQPGDLIFYGHPLHHVALYVGGGQIIHAPGSGRSVRYDSVYYWSELVGAGRVRG